MKILNILFLILIALIKYIESCMKLTNCEWTDPCNKYLEVEECLKHNECEMGVPQESGFYGHIEYGDDNPNNAIPPMNYGGEIHPPLVCIKKKFSKMLYQYKM